MLLYPRTERQARFLDLVESVAPTVVAHAAAHDRDGSFPVEAFTDLRRIGYQSLTVPEQYGGMGADLLEAVLAQNRLGRADGSTALCMNMHLVTMAAAANARVWPQPIFERLCREVVDGALINSAATEPELGSPASGGLPATRARRDGDGWRITGHKTFVSGSRALTYLLVPATIDDGADPPTICTFLVPNGVAGLMIEDAWDVMGMRSTASHDVRLEGVRVPNDAVLIQRRSGQPDPRAGHGAAWGPLTVSAVYLGVAEAARDFVVEFAAARTPTVLGRPINQLLSVQLKAADMEMALLTGTTLMLAAAHDWVRCPDRQAELAPKIAAVKTIAINRAIETVDIAMRIAGGVGLYRRLPLERYYRDVRAGLSHPPLEDRAREQIGRAVLQPGREGA